MADNKLDANKAEAKKAEAKKAAKKPAKNKKPNVFKRLLKYLNSCKGELKKITWPSVSQTTKNFGIVIAVIIIMGIFIFALDQGLYALLGLVMNTSSV